MDTKFSTAIHMLILVSEAEVPMNSEQIAHSVGTNASYIRRVATRLSRAGILEGRRGVSGFSLLKAPEDISLLEVYRAVEQTEDVHVFDVHQNPSDECIVGRNIRPVLNGMFRQAEQVVEHELAGATLADCTARMRERIESNEKSGKSTMRQEGKGR
ncbi:MAG: Rrf2 family transcriptional regulator [Olsenella sp.]|jgi:Rrf2 family protein|nr:Rrf2 family transcriptional regulator [Olsenella sp.]